MSTKALRLLRFTLLAAWLSGTTMYGQRERQIEAPSEATQQANQQYGRRFFAQLRAVFGRFRDADLQRVFDKAQPIQCSELISEKGEWRTVAFFNEKRELGDWYRSNFEEVRADLAVYIFKGVCRGEHGPVQLITKFPVTESVEAFERNKIPLNEVEVNVNAPVSSFYDPRSQAYSFDLPYLFLIRQTENEHLYSLDPPTLVGRDKYATEVVDHWECKSVSDDAVTYKFLICRSTTLGREQRNQGQAPAFGASAYFILSDGREASSSVKLSFGDDDKRTVKDASVPDVPEPEAPGQWEAPDSDEKIVDVARYQFRLLFNPQTWGNKLAAAQVVSGQRLISLESSSATPGADYCLWLPGASAVRTLPSLDPDSLTYTLTVHDQDSQSPTSMTFDVNMASSTHLGTLKCSFPRANSATSVSIGRWTAIVGDLLKFEIRP